MSTLKPSTPAPPSPKWDAAQWSDFTNVAQELVNSSSSPLPTGDEETSPALANVTKTADPVTPSLSSPLVCDWTINSETGSVRPIGSKVVVLPPPASPKTPEPKARPESASTAIQTPARCPSISPIVNAEDSDKAFCPKWAQKTAQTPVRWPSSPPIMLGPASSPPPLATDANPQGRWDSVPSPPKCDSSPFDISPPALPHHSSVFPISNLSVVTYLLTPPDTPPKLDSSSPFLNKTSWDRDDPRTWPVLHLPYHRESGKSVPTHIDEILARAHYKGTGAKVLHKLLSKAMKDMDDEDEKETGITEKERKERRKERRSLTFFCWPFNVNEDGVWKVESGMAGGELWFWRKIRDQAKSAGIEVR
jgi:hypothetical protein